MGSTKSALMDGDRVAGESPNPAGARLALARSTMGSAKMESANARVQMESAQSVLMDDEGAGFDMASANARLQTNARKKNGIGQERFVGRRW